MPSRRPPASDRIGRPPPRGLVTYTAHYLAAILTELHNYQDYPCAWPWDKTAAPYHPPVGYERIPYPFNTPTDEVWFAEHGSPPSLDAPGPLSEPPPPKQKQPAPKLRLAPIRRTGVDV